MRFRLRLAIGGLLALLVSTVGGPALADSSQVPPAEVLKTLGVSRQPSDYVIIVDISGSMADQNRYSRVTSAVRSLLLTLQSDDHVSVVTFNATAKVAYRGPVGTDPLAALDGLPSRPGGTGSDIGAGIAAGLTELESAHAKPAGAIVLITDGKLNAIKGSPYRSSDSPAWAELKQRGAALSARHLILGYAVALDAGADARMLRTVFPDAGDIPAASIEKRLAALESSLLNFQARQILVSDAAHGLQASWTPDLTTLSTRGGTVNGMLTLTSTYRHIPVEVKALTARTEGDVAVDVGGLSATSQLAPGQSVAVPLALTYSGAGQGRLLFSGTVTTPWRDAMSTFEVRFAPTLAAEVPLAVSEPPAWVTWLPWLGLGGTGLAALVLVVMVIRAVTTPKLVGSLAVDLLDVRADDILLSGRSREIKRGTSVPGLWATVTGANRRDAGGTRRPAARVRVQIGKAKADKVLHDGDSMTLGDVRLTYNSVRTRMLRLITAEPGQPTTPQGDAGLVPPRRSLRDE